MGGSRPPIAMVKWTRINAHICNWRVIHSFRMLWVIDCNDYVVATEIEEFNNTLNHSHAELYPFRVLIAN